MPVSMMPILTPAPVMSEGRPSVLPQTLGALMNGTLVLFTRYSGAITRTRLTPGSRRIMSSFAGSTLTATALSTRVRRNISLAWIGAAAIVAISCWWRGPSSAILARAAALALARAWAGGTVLLASAAAQSTAAGGWLSSTITGTWPLALAAALAGTVTFADAPPRCCGAPQGVVAPAAATAMPSARSSVRRKSCCGPRLIKPPRNGGVSRWGTPQDRQAGAVLASDLGCYGRYSIVTSVPPSVQADAISRGG